MNERIKRIVDFIKSKIKGKPEIAIISSREIKNYFHKMKNKIEINYTDIPDFPSKVSDNNGKYVFGTIDGKYIMVMFGRLHTYNNYNSGETSIPICVMKELGVKKVIITSSCGAIREKFKIGELLLIRDHINLSGHNPLNELEVDARVKFCDISRAYDEELNDLAIEAGKIFKFKIKKATIVQYPGPTSETPGEISLAKKAGADVAGFNFIYDAVLSAYFGMRCLAIGVITNYAAAYSKNPLKYEDIKYNLQCSDDYFSDYLIEVIKKI